MTDLIFLEEVPQVFLFKYGDEVDLFLGNIWTKLVFDMMQFFVLLLS